MRININFASRKYLVFRQVYVVFIVALAVGAGIFAAQYHAFNDASSREAVLEGRLAAQEKVLAGLQRRAAELRKQVPADEVRTLAQQADFANAAISTRAFSWTAFLNRLEDVVPDGVGITMINPNFVNLEVEIAGTALSLGQATEFIDNLTRSQYFEDVPPVFHTSEMVADKDIDKTVQVFSLRIRYNPDGLEAGGADGKDGKP